MGFLYRMMLVILALLLPARAYGQEAGLLQSRQNLQPSLVRIAAFSVRASGQKKVLMGEQQGNGIIIDTSGVIVTNTHIIAGREHILVTLWDGTTLDASLLYVGEADFSFLKITPPRPLKAIARADFARIKPRDPVIAMLHTQGVATGTIVRLMHEWESTGIDMLELELGLHPGDSGGPVFSQEGSLLGLIMGQQKSDTGISYAISSLKIWKEYEKYNGSVLVGAEN